MCSRTSETRPLTAADAAAGSSGARATSWWPARWRPRWRCWQRQGSSCAARFSRGVPTPATPSTTRSSCAWQHPVRRAPRAGGRSRTWWTDCGPPRASRRPPPRLSSRSGTPTRRMASRRATRTPVRGAPGRWRSTSRSAPTTSARSGCPFSAGANSRAPRRQATGSTAVIIDEPLARELFPGRDPVGQFVEFPGRAPGTAVQKVYQVVGLAAGQRDRLTDVAAVPHVYRPIGASQRGQLNIHVRLATGGSPASPETLRRIRDIVRAAEPRLVMVDVSTFEQARDRVPSSWLIRAAGAAFGTLGARRAGHGGDWALRREGLPRRAARARDRHPDGARRHSAQRDRDGAEGRQRRGRGRLAPRVRAGARGGVPRQQPAGRRPPARSPGVHARDGRSRRRRLRRPATFPPAGRHGSTRRWRSRASSDAPEARAAAPSQCSPARSHGGPRVTAIGPWLAAPRRCSGRP